MRNTVYGLIPRLEHWCEDELPASKPDLEQAKELGLLRGLTTFDINDNPEYIARFALDVVEAQSRRRGLHLLVKGARKCADGRS